MKCNFPGRNQKLCICLCDRVIINVVMSLCPKNEPSFDKLNTGVDLMGWIGWLATPASLHFWGRLRLKLRKGTKLLRR